MLERRYYHCTFPVCARAQRDQVWSYSPMAAAAQYYNQRLGLYPGSSHVDVEGKIYTVTVDQSGNLSVKK